MLIITLPMIQARRYCSLCMDWLWPFRPLAVGGTSWTGNAQLDVSLTHSSLRTPFPY